MASAKAPQPPRTPLWISIVLGPLSLTFMRTCTTHPLSRAHPLEISSFRTQEHASSLRKALTMKPLNCTQHPDQRINLWCAVSAVCVCVCACVLACVRACVRACVLTYIRVCHCVYACKRACQCIRAYVRVHACVHTCECVRACIRASACVCACMRACVLQVDAS
jgi:hypothetical protein